MESIDSSQTSPSRGLFWAIVGCVCVALVSRLCFLGEPFKDDAGIYIYLGKLIWTGGHPYVDLWDTKLPSVPLLMAPLWAAFGNHWAGYVLLQAAMGIAAPVALAYAMRRAIGPWTFVPALLGGLIVFNISRINLTGFQLETVQVFFETLAACAVLAALTGSSATPWFFAGLLAGVAGMAKPTGLAVVAAASVALLWQARDRQWKPAVAAIVVMGVGVMIPVVGTLAWVLHSSVQREMPHLLTEIGLYASGTPWRSLLQVKTWIFFVLPVVPFGMRWLFSQRDESTARPTNFGVIACFAITWFATEVFAVVLQKRLYSYHFFVLAPPAVMLLALWPRRGGLFPILIGIAPVAILSLGSSVRPWQALRSPQPMTVSRYIAERTEPTDTVWGDPECRLLLEAGRPAGARLQMSFYLVNHDAAPAEFGKQLIDDFEQRKPVYIVLPQEWLKQVDHMADVTPGLMWQPKRKAAYLRAIGELQAYFDQHYQREAVLDGKQVLRRIG